MGRSHFVLYSPNKEAVMIKIHCYDIIFIITIALLFFIQTSAVYDKPVFNYSAIDWNFHALLQQLPQINKKKIVVTCYKNVYLVHFVMQNLPAALKGLDNGFTYTSIVKRLPIILNQMIAENNFDNEMVNNLRQLEYDIVSEKG
jgi:hypothetical protein